VKFMELHKKYWPGWEGEIEVRQIMEAGDFAAQQEQRAFSAHHEDAGRDTDRSG
jgi:hypothetical protein